ncbi:MAG TPA: ADOP family duplicated permease [Vicinamibacterales bacterium]|nr:ADOP family duplicated permease [Vicinamibacterales bacterium]
MTFLRDVKIAARSLARARGLSLTVIATLALGIGANAAIFSVVRGVLLKPLVNRDESRLIYIRQSAQGIGTDNAAFSVPEIVDLKARIKTISAFGDFSQIGFTMIGLGDARTIRAGVVSGSYFEVMGLKPVIGRLIDARDDGRDAPGVAVLTYRFWTESLKSDPSVLGRVIRLGTRSATIIGVLEPSVPYPAETELIANVVTSPHHMSATMVQGRVHRMTELFGRLAPGQTLESARAELKAVHASIVSEHPESYPDRANFGIDARLLRDQITARAQTVLWVLLAASTLIFVIACSNVANLVLARTVRRESELSVRAALGAGTGALRRLLLAESLVLCGTGALIGGLIARPMVAVLARYASRFSVRALDLTVDFSLVWVGVGLALVAAFILAFVPRLPVSVPIASSTGGVRITGATNRRLRTFATVQIAACFLLLAGAGMLLKTLLALQSAQTGFDTRHVLAVNLPVMQYGRTTPQIIAFYEEMVRRVKALPGVDDVALGSSVPWRDAGGFGPGFQFAAEGVTKAAGEEDARARFRAVTPRFFASLGVPIIAGRDFNESDRANSESVVVISESLAQRMFPNQDAVNRHISWTDPVMKFIDVHQNPRRIVGVAKDVDDENIVPGPAFTIYHPFEQIPGFVGRLFVHTRQDPYGLVAPMTRVIRDMSAEQPVERAATLEDVRAEVLTPDRLNTVVFGGFAAVALVISIVGVAGVLAFSVSARTREFGIRLAIGSQPASILTGVLREGVVMVALGIVAGGVGGYALAKIVASYIADIRLPGAMPIAGSAAVLVIAAVTAALLPALRAARVDVIEALRSE